LRGLASKCPFRARPFSVRCSHGCEGTGTVRLNIGEVAHRGVVTCKAASTADEIARIMLDNDVSAVVVVDERLEACGLVTKTDLAACYGGDLSTIVARDIMSPKLLTAVPETPVREAAENMLAHKIHQLVLVEGAGTDRRPLGIFTLGDVVALMAGESGPRSEAQIQCSKCIRRLLPVSPREAVGQRER